MSLYPGNDRTRCRGAVLSGRESRTLPSMRALHLVLYIIAAACFVAAIFIQETARVTATTPVAGPTGPVVETVSTSAVTRRLQLIAGGLLAWVLNPIASLINDMVND